MRCETCLAADDLDPIAEFATFQSGLTTEGAAVTFVGIARPTSVSGAKVTGMFLDHHPRLTLASLNSIAEDAGKRFGTSAIRIVHRCGLVRPNEAIVFVATASPHRRASFEAAEYAMDRLKTDAYFWKREDTVDGSTWIEPTIIDRADRSRWSS
ncbi:molybdenum cofactor biosynthesis protein MoaE [Sphingomonas sp. HDW15A]|uniref:molybdenum cofactor biosynthesis protein MoaE n=1 Tax=Sphingomonas sp. HDW15A TaxID=2714942 RepID=UPI00140DF3F1|nr:molybdenum cofactor biosynthesis protein MoaE [Sphingomonas sp. HDW15A]QIK95777.1 molybdenum cofactor biosynthesis protein MoaE [Sphingomonas sp. HDW15A]